MLGLLSRCQLPRWFSTHLSKCSFLQDRETQRTASSQPQVSNPGLSDEQRDRMLRNRKLAEEKRLARIREKAEASQVDDPSLDFDSGPVFDDEVQSQILKRPEESAEMDD